MATEARVANHDLAAEPAGVTSKTASSVICVVPRGSGRIPMLHLRNGLLVSSRHRLRLPERR